MRAQIPSIANSINGRIIERNPRRFAGHKWVEIGLINEIGRARLSGR